MGHHVLVAINAVADSPGPRNVELRKGKEWRRDAEWRQLAGEYAEADAWHPVRTRHGIDAHRCSKVGSGT